MVAYAYRMGIGWAGDITRHHFQTEPCAASAATPPTAFGQPVTVDQTTQTVRPLVVGDVALTAIYGITVRMFPGQMAVAPLPYGGSPLGYNTTPPSPPQPIDILRSGYIVVPVVGASKKGMPVFIWVAATAAPHVQGGFEIAASAGNTVALTDSRTTFNGSPDASGMVELAFNV